MRRLVSVAVLTAAAALVPGGAATSSKPPPTPLLTYVVEPLKAAHADFFPGGLCASDLRGHTFRVTDPGSDEKPAWSPDGSRIALLRGGLHKGEDHVYDVVVTDAQGRLKQALTTNGRGGPSRVAWSPDGRAVGFAWNGLGASLIIRNLDGSPGYHLDVFYPGTFSPPSWSPDGQKVLFSVSGQAPPGGSVPGTYVMSPDGTNLHLLLASAQVPTWSPDGRQFAYLSDTGMLGVAQADGSNPHLLNVQSNVSASWSYDSTRLAYVDPSGNLGIVQVDGSGSRTLTQQVSTLYSPAWLPNGELIAFTRGVRSSARIVFIRTDGTGETILATNGLAAHGPVWGPPGVRPAGARPCAVRGTARANVLRGTGRGDLILAGPGNDTVYGRGGPDALVGGSGHDKLYGGAGDDVLNAWDRSRDALSGGPGKDTAFADFVDRATSVEHLHRRR